MAVFSLLYQANHPFFLDHLQILQLIAIYAMVLVIGEYSAWPALVTEDFVLLTGSVSSENYFNGRQKVIYSEFNYSLSLTL